MNGVNFFIIKCYALLAPLRFFIAGITASPWQFVKILSISVYFEIFSIFAPAHPPAPAMKFKPSDKAFMLGYNLETKNYGHVLSVNVLFRKKSDFDINYFSNLFRMAKFAGADIVKINLFPALQGVLLDETKTLSKGLSPDLLKNTEKILLLANYYKIKVYIGLLKGSDAYYVSKKPGSLREYFFNLFSNENSGLILFERRVLEPLLVFLDKFDRTHPDTIYAIDLLNEIQGVTHYGYFKNPWNGSREWIMHVVKFARSISPTINFTVSGAWDNPALDLMTGYFTDLGLDFYDLHLYSDRGDIRFLNFICSKAFYDKKPIILGEFGQISEIISDQLQIESARNFLSVASKSCFSSAIAWHLGGNYDHLSFSRLDGDFRPAVNLLRKFSGLE